MSLPGTVADLKERVVVLLQVKIRQLEELLKRVDLRLHNHIISHEVQYLYVCAAFLIRWKADLEQKKDFQAVLRIRIRIHWIHVFFGLPDPDLSVRGMDPDLDPSITKPKM